MELMQALATDFRECFEFGYTPDPSIVVMLAMEASTSFVGMGPTMRRRLALLNAIISICNIEEDKKAISKCDAELRAELITMQSLSAMASKETINGFKDHLGSSYDVRKHLGEGDAVEFWVASFGKDSFEVPWTRFRVSFLKHFGQNFAKQLDKLKVIILDFRGFVTVDHLKGFLGSSGSLLTAMKVLEKGKSIKNLSDVGSEASKLTRGQSQLAIAAGAASAATGALASEQDEAEEAMGDAAGNMPNLKITVPEDDDAGMLPQIPGAGSLG